MRAIKTITVVFLFALSAVATDLVGSLKEAITIAEAQEKAPATRGYFEHDLLRFYERRYGPVFQACFASTNQPDSTPFEFVAAIGADGRVMKVYTSQDTEILRCVRQTLEKDEFPKPPLAPYYLHIDMRFGDDADVVSPAEPVPPLIVEPNKYSYTFGVPKGWEFSSEQAHRRGAALAFFPDGGSFNESSSVIYVNEIDDGCTNCLNVFPERIASTIRSVEDDSPAVQITTEHPLKTKDGGFAQIRLLKDAQDPREPKTRKDNEALAFIGHDETIILLVLSVRDKRTWDQDYSAFQEVIAGHKFFNCDSPDLRVPCKR
jgi:hypothetical protein